MDKITSLNINKDLILRENLAIERTDMAITTTLLAFIRTSLYFAIAGMSVNNLLKIGYGLWIEIIFWTISVIILVVGVISFINQKSRLKNNKKHIGSYKLNYEALK